MKRNVGIVSAVHHEWEDSNIYCHLLLNTEALYGVMFVQDTNMVLSSRPQVFFRKT